MTFTTLQTTELKSDPLTVTSTFSRKRGLVAQWHRVDGKLVQTWSPAEF